MSEGAPAHDGQPAETPFQGCIDEALDWLDEKIDLLGQPCVALIDSGTQWGPIDGTSAVSRKIDEVFGLDRPGRVDASPSGDDRRAATARCGSGSPATAARERCVSMASRVRGGEGGLPGRRRR